MDENLTGFENLEMVGRLYHLGRAGLLMTRETTPLEPDVLEHKFYGNGVGPILALGLPGGIGREELLSHERGR